MCGQGEHVCDVTTLTAAEVNTRVDALWNRRAEVREQLRVRMKSIRQQAQHNVELIKQLLMMYRDR